MLTGPLGVERDVGGAGIRIGHIQYDSSASSCAAATCRSSQLTASANVRPGRAGA